ncbi:MAG: serine O-acetyltransferase [Elusimicrobia bacterium]|jgi:serine O-acetyltransferase|nr:serine O-acetyltransferase [Elusimicrobiota bacterium]
MFKKIKKDIDTVFKRDPAAKNIVEILLCYPGLHAIIIHRVANKLYGKKEYTAARIISHIAKFLTSIEIHPGAKIAESVFIDHGSGVVIGETAEIGKNCLIYQGVVLGGTSLLKKKRHPTLEEGVIAGAGSIILGPVIIGKGARIGAGAVVINNVPPGATAVGVPAKIGVGFSGKDIKALEHNRLPDPVADAVKYFMEENNKLEGRIKELEKLEGVKSHIDKIMEDKKEEIIKEFSSPDDSSYIDGGGI